MSCLRIGCICFVFFKKKNIIGWKAFRFVVLDKNLSVTLSYCECVYWHIVRTVRKRSVYLAPRILLSGKVSVSLAQCLVSSWSQQSALFAVVSPTLTLLIPSINGREGHPIQRRQRHQPLLHPHQPLQRIGIEEKKGEDKNFKNRSTNCRNFPTSKSPTKAHLAHMGWEWKVQCKRKLD